MNFYLDFEATQYSERIISIGCIAENGARFETLVKPATLVCALSMFMREIKK